MRRFPALAKHRLMGTRKIVVISDLSQAELLAMQDDKEEGMAQANALVASHVWEPPPGEWADVGEELAAPIPLGWLPETLVFTEAEIESELSTGQACDLVEGMVALSGGGTIARSFRDSPGEADSVESGRNGAEVQHEAVKPAERVG
jgi:hypothetical protein